MAPAQRGHGFLSRRARSARLHYRLQGSSADKLRLGIPYSAAALCPYHPAFRPRPPAPLPGTG
jgi:hypothetical protein